MIIDNLGSRLTDQSIHSLGDNASVEHNNTNSHISSDDKINIQLIFIEGGTLTPRLPSDEERLLELLFDGYNPSARPVINSSHTVDVQMQFSLLQIQELVCSQKVFIITWYLPCFANKFFWYICKTANIN